MSVTSTALLVIDMQRDFLDPGGYAANAGLDITALCQPIPAIASLLGQARASKVLVIHTREGHRPDMLDCPPYKRQRSRAAGAEIGSLGPLGRLLIRGEPGHDIITELCPQAGEPVVDKPGYSAFAHTDLDNLLRNAGIDRLLITGVTTEVCVHSTLRDAVDRGYYCMLVADACGSAYPQLHAAALEMVLVEGGIFGQVLSSGEALELLCSGGDLR